MQVAKDQFQRQAQEKAAEVNRQQTELQTLRVWVRHVDLQTSNSAFDGFNQLMHA